LGLSNEGRGQKVPCLALYNLKLYSESDPLIKKHISFSIHDLYVSNSVESITKHILKERPDILALSCYIWSTDKLLKASKIIKKYLPKTKIILGGPDVGARAANILKKESYITAIIDGEGEESFRQLLKNLLTSKQNWNQTPGLIYQSNGEIIANPRPVPVELDKIPFAFHDSNFQKLYGNWFFTESSRGCRYKCIYCNYHAQGYKWRTRSTKLILDAIDYAASKNEKVITFIDAGFNQNKKRFREILNHIKKYPNMKIDGLEINVEDLEDEDIRLISEIGEPHLAIGLQTTNPKSLDAICRKYNPTTFKNRIEKIRSYGLTFNLDLIAGLPEDNYEGLKKSIDVACSLNPDYFRVFPLSILPGTVLEQKANVWKIQYQKKPPYRIEESKTFPKKDLKKALRLAQANDILNLCSFNSIGFRSLAKKQDKSYSELLEDFLSGKWRNRRISDNELAKWGTRKESDNALTALITFARYHCKNKEHLEIIENLFRFQHALGKIYFLESLNKESTQKNKLVKSRYVQALHLDFDILPYIRNKSTFSKIKEDSHILLMQRTLKTVKYMKISPAIAHILELADGKRTKKQIVDQLLKDTDKSKQEHNKKRLLNTIDDLIERKILIF